MPYAKVAVIGLDCAPPELVFDEWRSDLPTLDRLMRAGVYGPLESTIPPITVPAWMCMMTGRDPGALGIYGFRNRKDRSYDALSFANSRMVTEQAVWDVLGQHGRRSILLGIPLTYPPKPIEGMTVSGFLAPDTTAEYTYPAALKDEIARVVGDYIIDVRDFRNADRDDLLAGIYAMTEKRFRLARHLVTSYPWDLFAMVEMGTDRIHHAFWRYFDPAHPLYTRGNPYESAIHDYYVALDRHVGELIDALPGDTLVMVVSDHGAKRMDGAICFNEWLVREGYLTLRETPTGVTKFSPELVDWSRTRAWGDGGYYGRLFLNVERREPQGTVPPDQVEGLLDELTAKLTALGDEHGSAIGTRVFRPSQVYAATRGVPPDLIVYFGDLNWRSVGSVGHSSVWTHENDTGPDDANHAQFGIAICSGKGQYVTASPGRPAGPAAGNASEHRTPNTERPAPITPHTPPQPADPAYRSGMSIYGIAPTILQSLGIDAPPGMAGAPIDTVKADEVYTADEEAEIARRLEELGYL